MSTSRDRGDPAPRRGSASGSAIVDGCAPLDRWRLLSAVKRLRDRLGIGTREIVVLQALLGVLPSNSLPHGPGAVVFASNRTLCDRACGMEERTLRRGLARLIEAGLIARRSSANGKRFPLRRGGDVVAAFGIDLSPLVDRAAEILAGALAAEDEAQRTLILRARLLARRAELLGVADGFCVTAARLLADIPRLLRRKLALPALQAMAALLDSLASTRDVTADKILDADPPAPHLDPVTPRAPVADDAEPVRTVTIDQGESGTAPRGSARVTASDGRSVRHKDVEPEESGRSATWRDARGDDPLALHVTCPTIAEWLPGDLREPRRLAHLAAKLAGLRNDVVETSIERIGPIRTLKIMDELMRCAESIRHPSAWFAAATTAVAARNRDLR